MSDRHNPIKAPPECRGCIDETDCSSAPVCAATAEACGDHNAIDRSDPAFAETRRERFFADGDNG